jgi:hypothetical protein
VRGAVKKLKGHTGREAIVAPVDKKNSFTRLQMPTSAGQMVEGEGDAFLVRQTQEQEI